MLPSTSIDRGRARRRVYAVGAAGALLTGLVTGAAGPAGADPNNNTSEKLRAAVTLEGVKRHLSAWQAIADANGKNRYAGLPGYEKSADYVIGQLKAAGYTPTTQTFTYFGFREAAPATLTQTAPTATTYVRATDFNILSYSGSGDVTAPVAAPSGDARGCYAADFAGFPAGSIALVSRGTPAGFPGGACTFRIKVQNAAAAGAVGALVYNNVAGVVNGTLGQGGLSTIPALGISQALGQQLLQVQGLRMRMTTSTEGGELTTRNVLAELRGRSADTNVVMAGAHLDSVAAGPGINDNGSGSAAVLETAIQMAKVKPRNTVRFAWWSAEESGLIGSNHYVNTLTQAERDKIALYLNFDMIGSPNFARFVYDGDNSAFPADGGVTSAKGPPGSGTIESMFVEYFNSRGLPTEPTPFSGRSDYGRFIFFGIPSGGLFTGAEGIKTAAQAAKFGGDAGIAYDKCYHQACDTIGNVNDVALDQNSDAVAHAVLTYAQNTESINAQRGKGNFRGTPTATNDGTGTPSGGGLHDHDHDHDHEEDAA